MDDEVFQEHITVDLTGCKYGMEFWERIKLGFGFQEPFGENRDAFWDLLSWECPASKVTIIGANTLPKSWKALDGKTYPEKIRKILQRNKEDRKNTTTNSIMNLLIHNCFSARQAAHPAVRWTQLSGRLLKPTKTWKLAGRFDLPVVLCYFSAKDIAPCRTAVFACFGLLRAPAHGAYLEALRLLPDFP